jgi:hypothetical protein
MGGWKIKACEEKKLATKLARSTSLIGLNSQLKLNSKILRSLNSQGKRGGGTTDRPFYRRAKGRSAGLGGWLASTKIMNFDAPPISKSHGEDQKEMWKEEKFEK